jgi:carbon-monoxide dehydrogenase medium subunit
MISVLRPKTRIELFDILDKENKDFVFIAGGTDVMPSLKKGIEKRESFIDLSFLKKEFSGIEQVDSNIIVKSLTTFSNIQKNDLIKNNFPSFIKASKLIGGYTIQSMATLAGNIVNASPAADSLPALLSLNAKVTLLSSKGERIIEMKDFYKGYKQLELKNNEIISNIIIPISDYKSDFIEVGTRKAMSITKISLAYSYKDKNILLSAGSAFAYPKRLFEAEKRFFDVGLTKKDFENILKNDVSPLDDIRSSGNYRFNVLRNLVFNLYQELQ